MWLAYVIGIALVAGVVLAVFAGGPIGFVLLGIAIVGLIAKFGGNLAGQGRTTDPPETVPGGHKATGHAHAGQENMVP